MRSRLRRGIGKEFGKTDKQVSPAQFSEEVYSFRKYESKHRFLTYWYQLSEIDALAPQRVIEVGIGSGAVTSYLRGKGIEVTTVDINPQLKPDVLGSVTELDALCTEVADLVLCSRVLHHLPFECFESAIRQLGLATSRYVLLTLPVDDFSVYMMLRVTSSTFRTLSLRLPRSLKRRLFSKLYAYSGRTSTLWKIADSPERSLDRIREIVDRHFIIQKAYRVPEDGAHFMMVLEKRPDISSSR